jgi:biotin operon repressor
VNATERLYVWLNNATFVEEKGCSHPLDVIAVSIGCSERTVIRCVKHLEAAGRVRVKRSRTRGRANTYWVDCWNPSKRCGVLAVLDGGREEVARRRTLKHERELSRLARRAACHPKENSRPSRAQTPVVNPFLAEAVVNQRGWSRGRNGLSRRTWMQEARFHRQRHIQAAPDLISQPLLEEIETLRGINRDLQYELNRAMEAEAAANEVAAAAGKEVTNLKRKLTTQHNESVLAEKIEQVIAHWRTHRPKTTRAFEKPTSKAYGIIKSALVLMEDDDAGPVSACCEAIDGLHLAPYQEYDRWYATDGPNRTLRNGVEYALGDESRIERCRAMARRARNASLEAKLRAYQTSGEVHEAWTRALLDELYAGEPDGSIEVGGIVVRP